jgi:hypothetical protein
MSTERPTPETPDLPEPVAADAHARERLDEQPVAIEDEAGGCLAHYDGEGFAVAIFATGDISESELHEATAATYRQLASHLHASGRLGGDRR